MEKDSSLHQPEVQQDVVVVHEAGALNSERDSALALSGSEHARISRQAEAAGVRDAPLARLRRELKTEIP
ncbi:hypothetical protein H4Q26_006204 [Puccinia striiformis f. sp. tritici PST-130]|nr:hypothetical protein H4Q26_006204 [Puccinia striiformis f. sp. tritici PST-130]